ncbi:transcriptional regulator [Paraburkholderia ginsengiterrae]|uniref:Transcriptional regulator n=1 Tax=Paraburkholderia ginsengiterrae TaxID=1462993 RepID=A0A1A9MYH8_9BURK|nr:helix-turn-helix domain-containing protein [Paraburkholderia ginsengiterrae]OAJ51739.1 transcriptional regulator [Paraburkholderia ginsengiterrae]OAJ53656.1 transcriptional regulator [Paraburkholderia ginsengiterrae]
MTALPDKSATLCPVARSQAVIGDRWTVLIVRELFMGNRRFDSLLAQSQATPQMLSSRLKRLEADGMIERKRYMKKPPRYEYELTEMGRAFYPVILALREWGETWHKSPDEDVAVRYTHLTCGHDAGIGTVCQACGESLRREDLKAELSPSYAQERAARQDAVKTGKSA